MTVDPHDIKALTFDVFGTVVDWRGTIIREGQELGEAKGLEVDWACLADQWRAGYGPAMDRVRRGELPWTKIDDLHRMILDNLLDEFGIEGLSEEEVHHLNRVWHRLQPWPDAVSGLTRLKRRYIIATLSNGNISLLTNMAKHAGLPWDCILSSELARHYKPDKEVYQTAAYLLDLPPEQIMMVAAHEGDLRAAKRVGFVTAYVPRPREHGPNREFHPIEGATFDIVAQDFDNLATQLGV
jgi:2-haloacid dehalogenase